MRKVFNSFALSYSSARLCVFQSGSYRDNARPVELCTPETALVQKGVLKTRYLFLNPLKIMQGVQSVDTRLMVHTVKDVLFYEKNLRKIWFHIFESSDDSTNVVNAPRDPFVVKQDHGVNPPHIDNCCCECGNALDGIYCQQCICKSCGKGAHTSYNCPPKVPIISNPKPCNQPMNNELPQTLPSFDSTCYSDKENSVPCVSKPNFVDESSKVFNPPPKPPIYYCEFCGSIAQYGHYYTPQAPVINPEPGYSQDLNFSQNIHDFQQQKFNRYSFFETPKVLLLAWDRVFKIKDALGTKQYKPEDIQELFRQLLNDVQNIHEELADYINTPDEVIKFSVENLVPIPSESEGILEHMCDVPFHDNSPPLDVSKDQFKDFFEYNDEFSSTDNDSFSIDNIDYVEASPPDSELVSSEVMEIVIPEVGRIDDDFLLTINDDILREKLLNVNLLITKIEAFNDNLTPSSDCKTKSSSTSLNSLLEDTNTFHNSLPEFENFYFDLGEISSGSTTTHSDISLPGYEAFYFDEDHVKEISSGSPTTQSDISLSKYDSFIFDLCHPSDRSDFYEFTDELAHIISPPEYDCFYFWDLPDPGELMSILNSGIRENLSSTTCVNLPIEDDHSPLLAYVVWIFLAYLTYPVIPLYLYPFGNEDTIFDPGITINRVYSFKPGLSHRILENLKTLAKGFYPPSLKFLSFNWESSWSISITFRFSVGFQTPDDLSRSRLGFIEKMSVHG
nr:hypothetical protein [Tanacetum cinerariifolium]